MFVVVHPSTTSQMPSDVTQPGDGTRIHRSSSYILLCDGRKGDGMRCEVANEAALRRYSYAPSSQSGGPDIKEGIGTVTDVSVRHHDEKHEGEGAPAMPTPAAAPPIVPPVTPPTPTPTPGGKK
jgi:hypothetical protein